MNELNMVFVASQRSKRKSRRTEMWLSELKKRMKGVDVVQVTLFNTDGSVDLDSMRTNTRWLAEYGAGKDFIITPVGSTGEFYAAK